MRPFRSVLAPFALVEHSDHISAARIATGLRMCSICSPTTRCAFQKLIAHSAMLPASAHWLASPPSPCTSNAAQGHSRSLRPSRKRDKQKQAAALEHVVRVEWYLLRMQFPVRQRMREPRADEVAMVECRLTGSARYTRGATAPGSERDQNGKKCGEDAARFRESQSSGDLNWKTAAVTAVTYRRSDGGRQGPNRSGWICATAAHGLSRNPGGQGRNRTTDTRIFSPLLYQLSYLAVLN